MNLVLLRRTFAANALRLAACTVLIVIWGAILPVIYSSLGPTIKSIAQGNPLITQFTQFGGGDFFSLPGIIAIGFIHPITLLLLGIFAVGFGTAAVAGERQRGTLEVLLARPLSRGSVHVTFLVAGAAFVAVLLAAELLAGVISAELVGVGSELQLANVPLLWFNGWLLFVAFLAIALAASVSFDRLAPALGITLAIVLVNYFIDVIGSLWPDGRWLSDYNVFALVPAKEVLTSGLVWVDVAWLIAIIVVAIAFAWIVFPRRDLAAPS
jgi:ABC-2 type transport system permease protein